MEFESFLSLSFYDCRRTWSAKCARFVPPSALSLSLSLLFFLLVAGGEEESAEAGATAAVVAAAHKFAVLSSTAPPFFSVQ